MVHFRQRYVLMYASRCWGSGFIHSSVFYKIILYKMGRFLKWPVPKNLNGVKVKREKVSSRFRFPSVKALWEMDICVTKSQSACGFSIISLTEPAETLSSPFNPRLRTRTILFSEELVTWRHYHVIVTSNGKWGRWCVWEGKKKRFKVEPENLEQQSSKPYQLWKSLLDYSFC